MRRWITLLFVLLLAGCGGSGVKLPTEAPTATGAPAASPSAAPTVEATATTAAATATATASPIATPTALVAPPASAAAVTSSPSPAATAMMSAPSAPAGTPTPQAAAGDNLAAMHIGDKGFGYGFNVWGVTGSTAAQDKILSDVQGAGFGWVRQQVLWASMEPTKGAFGNDFTAQLDKFVAAAADKKVNVMLSVVKSPMWAGANGGLPTKTQDFADFMTFLTNRYKGKVAAYEIWNEQNYAIETGGKVNVPAYLPILKTGYQTVKKIDPKAVVVFGGLTPTGVDDPAIALNDVQYLRQIYAINGGEVKQYYDVLGAHPGSNCNPPDNAYPANPATNPCGTDPDGGRSYTKDDSFYFQRIQEQRKVMEDAGENGKKMWLTEFGWTTANQAKGYEYGKYVSDMQQAQYLVRAFELGRSYPWMGAMFVWNLNFATITQPSDEKHPWGVLDAMGNPRPSYVALKNMPK